MTGGPEMATQAAPGSGGGGANLPPVAAIGEGDVPEPGRGAPARAVLPMRRPNLSVSLDWGGLPLSVTAGFCPATGAVREVFADTAKGGQIAHVLADGCVLISIALQNGIALAALAKSLGRVPGFVNGAEADLPASPIGVIIGALQSIEADIGGAA